MAFSSDTVEKALLLGYDTPEEAIVDLYKKGYPVRVIQDKLKVSPLVIYHVLRMYDVPLRAGHSRKESVVERLESGRFAGSVEDAIKALERGSVYEVRVVFGIGGEKAKRFRREWNALPEEERERIRQALSNRVPEGVR